jgi:hypothetical protein
MEPAANPVLCPDHQVAPAVILSANPTGVGLRVSGCCQDFVDTVQANFKGLLTTINPSAEGLVGLNLVVHLPDWNKAYEFEVARIDRLVIGRLDPDTGQRPDIDLSAYGAYENGVSRRHASILRWYQGLYIMDEGSPNGTHLNDKMLLPNLPYMLRFGDRIRIGRLIFEIHLVYPQNTA